MPPLLAPLLLAASATLSLPAAAHGRAEARHGGIVQAAHDLGFELVRAPAGVWLYVDDHGQPMDPAGLSGSLTVLQGGQTRELPLGVAAGRLEAPGLTLQPGAKLVARLKTREGKALTVRFTIR